MNPQLLFHSSDSFFFSPLFFLSFFPLTSSKERHRSVCPSLTWVMLLWAVESWDWRTPWRTLAFSCFCKSRAFDEVLKTHLLKDVFEETTVTLNLQLRRRGSVTGQIRWSLHLVSSNDMVISGANLWKAPDPPCPPPPTLHHRQIEKQE